MPPARMYLCDLGTDAIVRHRVQADGLAPEPDWTLRARPGSGRAIWSWPAR